MASPWTTGRSMAPQGNPFYDANGSFNMNQGLQSLVGGSFGSGVFNPTGQGPALDALRKYLTGLGQGQMRQQQLGADLYMPGDPMMANYARINGEQNMNTNLFNQLGGAQAGFARNNMDFLQQLLMQYMQPTLRRNPRQGASVSFGGYGINTGSNG